MATLTEMKLNPQMLLAMAICIVSLLLVPFVPDLGFRNLLVLISVLSVAAFVVLTVKGARRDAYSLEALRETHEREQLRELLDSQEKIIDGEVVCLVCGTEFDPSRSICPRCGARAGTTCR